MTQEHTPGPWANHSFTVQGPKGQIIADVCVKQPSHAAKLKPSEFEANARLIAAAPDLLNACKLAISFGSQGDTHEGLSVSEFLRAAVAKAEGGN